MKIIGRYKNGNYSTIIFDDGTKIRETEEDAFIPSFAENCDCKITNFCDIGCPMCHENSTTGGLHGDILNPKFLETMHPYTELAIGGGNALAHPDLIAFLEILKSKKVIANVTVNQVHFEKNIELIKELIDKKLIYGIGVSLVNPTDEFIEKVKLFPTAVIHVINGIFSESDIRRLENNNLKVLILGYKEFRRGEDYLKKESDSISKNKSWLEQNIMKISKTFKLISFDNLALEQLNMKDKISPDKWEELYMGDDGTMTFYIDLVEKKFARTSTTKERYELLENIDDMFHVILQNS